MNLPEELTQRATDVANRCILVSGILLDEANRLSRIDRIFLILNNGLGILAFLTISIVPFADAIPKIMQDIFTLGAAIALIIGPYIRAELLKDSPQRFKDYSRYISGYNDKIHHILTDVRSKNRYEKLVEIVQLAEQNLTDARTEWRHLLRQL